MSKRQKTWAAKARARLRITLGGRCAHCGATTNLEFDCVVPRGDEHHRAGSVGRTVFYRREHFTHGNLQLLCETCHARKTNTDAGNPRFGVSADGTPQPGPAATPPHSTSGGTWSQEAGSLPY